MARSRDRGATASCFLFLLFLAVGAAGTPEPSLQALSVPGGRSHLVLPLVLSRANSTRRSAVARRFLGRQLTASARMRLYDDLLTNGYYTTRLFIGTPPQEFALIVDSGSTVTYVPCSTCEQCGNHQDPRFQPDLSSTYEPVKCNVDCTCDKEQKQCVYERQYAEMSSSSGVLGEDLISFGKESELKPQRAVFGCENSETGDLFNQHADGIIGLGRGQLSIMDQLVEKGVISDSFSLCYGGMDIGGGAMVLGEITPPPDMVFSRSDPVRSPYYNIELKEINVDGKPLQLDPKIFDSRHGTVLDSGTTYAYLPEEAFIAFRDAIMSKLSLKQIPGPDPNYKDICFSGAGSDVSELSKFFPKVEMVFGNGENLSLAPENYLFRNLVAKAYSCTSGGSISGDFTQLYDSLGVSKKPPEKTAAALLCVSSFGCCRIRGVRILGFVIVSPLFLVMLAGFYVPPVDPSFGRPTRWNGGWERRVREREIWVIELEDSSVMTISNSGSGEASISSSDRLRGPAPPSPLRPPSIAVVKKKRNLPGTPDPEAEVVALSPRTLLATNRFVCEICSKGFQRDQNLQLHRRGHNLPWKLRQRTGKEPRKRVYVCPEAGCVHHDPSRALGDLTGIKKHFCRKHGEKKWKCDKCSKKYAVQSDWKAHSKICGTREYRCDCGTLFSRYSTRSRYLPHPNDSFLFRGLPFRS
ncbi:Eukaryotic aspartyl protease domain containing protein [Musa troglodytarum]|uniref:Eukaryotic aspartyl protease domain containing protein n=2 Tax=Magnoliopsida TaxID=3398 RepID=A0A9E7FR25_9LILI|nr:Eukaryotic aspartyl protease domain containing protein [Musa troglodytarum]